MNSHAQNILCHAEPPPHSRERYASARPLIPNGQRDVPDQWRGVHFVIACQHQSQHGPGCVHHVAVPQILVHLSVFRWSDMGQHSLQITS